MEKRFYYSPEMKFHQLRVRTSMLQSTTQEEIGGGSEGGNTEAKGFGSFTFEEDDD